MERLSFDRILGIAGVILAVLGIVLGLGVALAMDTRTKGELYFSIGCFVLSALVLSATICAWAYFAEVDLWGRALVAGLSGAVMMTSLVLGISWVRGRHERAAVTEEPKPIITPEPEKKTGVLEKPPTLSDLFNKDFSNTGKLTDELILTRQSDGELIHIKRQVYLDFDAKTKFVGFYISSSDQFSEETFRICKTLVDAVQPAIDGLSKKVEIRGGYRDESTSMKELMFSGRVFIYHEGFLSITQKADLISSYKAKNYDVQFRGLPYAADQATAWHHEHGFPKPDAKQP